MFLEGGRETLGVLPGTSVPPEKGENVNLPGPEGLPDPERIPVHRSPVPYSPEVRLGSSTRL